MGDDLKVSVGDLLRNKRPSDKLPLVNREMHEWAVRSAKLDRPVHISGHYLKRYRQRGATILDNQTLHLFALYRALEAVAADDGSCDFTAFETGGAPALLVDLTGAIGVVALLRLAKERADGPWIAVTCFRRSASTLGAAGRTTNWAGKGRAAASREGEDVDNEVVLDELELTPAQAYAEELMAQPRKQVVVVGVADAFLDSVRHWADPFGWDIVENIDIDSSGLAVNGIKEKAARLAKVDFIIAAAAAPQKSLQGIREAGIDVPVVVVPRWSRVVFRQQMAKMGFVPLNPYSRELLDAVERERRPKLKPGDLEAWTPEAVDGATAWLVVRMLLKTGFFRPTRDADYWLELAQSQYPDRFKVDVPELDVQPEQSQPPQLLFLEPKMDPDYPYSNPPPMSSPPTRAEQLAELKRRIQQLRDNFNLDELRYDAATDKMVVTFRQVETL